MNRRQSLLAIGAGTSLTLLLIVPALAGVREGVAIYDGRFADARTFASGFATRLDCQVDAAALWHRDILYALPLSGPLSGPLLGLTTPADALILADCGRRAGMLLERIPANGMPSRLVHWRMTLATKSHDNARRAGGLS